MVPDTIPNNGIMNIYSWQPHISNLVGKFHLYPQLWLKNILVSCFVEWLTSTCHKPPRYVPYKGTYVPYNGTYGTSNQGQTLDVWGSQTTESALRWLALYHSTSYSWSCSWSYSWSYSWTHVLRIMTMTSLILDHVAMGYLYLGTSMERKICSWNWPRTRLW